MSFTSTPVSTFTTPIATSSSSSTPSTSPIPLQVTISRRILINALFMMSTGLIFGTQIPNLPYRKLGVTAHVQFMNQSIVYIILSTLLYLQVVHITNRYILYIYQLSGFSSWIICISEVYASITGAYGLLKLAASGSGAPGGTQLQDTLIDVSHVIPSVFLIISVCSITYYAIQTTVSVSASVSPSKVINGNKKE